MAKYEDGSYGSAAGIALIAKVLAGRCAMKYTRVAVGKGNIPDDKTPKTMTEPADYVMDAVIAGITNRWMVSARSRCRSTRQMWTRASTARRLSFMQKTPMRRSPLYLSRAGK